METRVPWCLSILYWVDTLHRLTPGDSLSGLKFTSVFFEVLHSNKKTEKKLNDIQTTRNTHSCKQTPIHTFIHTCTHTCIFMNTYATTHEHTYMHIYTDGTQRTKIQVPAGESSNRGCIGKRHWGRTQGQVSALSIPPRANEVQLKPQGWEGRDRVVLKPPNTLELVGRETRR